MDQLLSEENMKSTILVASTILGAFGGFPTPPAIFTELVKSEVVQWFLVFVLAYQGGAGQNVKFALISTMVAYFIYKVLKCNDPKPKS